MATQTGPVTKIYRLSTEGYDKVHNELMQLFKDFQNIKKAKEELNKTASNTQNPAQLAAISKQLQDIAVKEGELSNKIKIRISDRKAEIEYERKYGETVSQTQAKVLTEFGKLNKVYREAKANAEELALTYGKDSQEAIKAAEAANVYYLQLKNINDAIKGRVQAKEPVATSSIQLPPEVQATSLAYDAYTGSVQKNLTALVENEAALALNKAAQKELNAAIAEAGAPTEAQTLRLVQLREGAAVLANQNRDLSTTIGNQVKEFNASAGSLDQMQAQLNNLQNSYERLSLAEREAPFGKELKAEIDTLQPKVLELENSLGKFQREVGKYPKGSYLGLKAELKDLTDQYNKLTAAERKSEKGIGLQGELGKVTEELGQMEKKSGSVFNKLGGLARSAVQFLPNFGYGALVGLLLLPFQAIASKIAEFTLKTKEASGSLEDLKQKAEDTTEAFDNAAKGFEDAYTQVGSLTNQVKLAKEGFIDKNKVVTEYNDTIGKTVGKVNDLDGVEQSLVKNGPAFVNMMLYKAAATAALQKASEKAFEAAQNARKKEAEFASTPEDIGSFLSSSGGGFGGYGSYTTNKALEKENANAIAGARQQRQLEAVAAAKKEENELKSIAEDFQEQAAKIAQDYNFDFFGGQFDNKKLKEKTDSLSVAEQNAIKLIDAFNSLALIRENKRVADIRKTRELTTDEEVEHLQNLQKINETYDEQRIRAVVGNNTAEQKFREEHRLKIVTDQIETSDKIKAIRKKEYDDEVALLKKQFDEESSLLKKRLETNESTVTLENESIQQSPAASETQKAIAAKDANDTLLQITEKYYADLEAAAINNKQKLDEIEEQKNKSLSVLKRKGLLDDISITKAYLKDIEISSEIEQNKRLIADGKAIADLYANRKLSTVKREAEIQKIKAKYDTDELKRLQDLAKKEIPILKALYDAQLLSAQEYYDRLKKLQDAITNAQQNKGSDKPAGKLKFKDLGTTQAPNVGGSIEDLTSNLDNLINVDPDSLIGVTIAQSFDFAANAMNAYFDNEAARIQQNLKIAEQRVDIETAQRLARAQSQAEEDSINRQAAQEKEKLERAAFEKNKRLQIKMAEINLSTQLSNLAVIAATPGPLNLITAGAWGIAFYAVQAALAFANFGLNVGKIKAAQFAAGGKVQPVPNGLIKMRPNIQEQRNGDSVFATVRPGEVILNEYQQRLLGGARTFRAIGVPGFASGGMVRNNNIASFNPHPYAPVFSADSYMANAGILSAINEQSKAIQETAAAQQEHGRAIQAVSEQLLNLEVHQVTSTVTKAQAKEVRQNSVGTLGTTKR